MDTYNQYIAKTKPGAWGGVQVSVGVQTIRLPRVGYPLLTTLMEHLHSIFYLVLDGTKHKHINSQSNIKIYTIKVKG